ncbi:putative phosphatidylinositol 4-kinase type 2-beta [Apostasia shenzhenica]|uniref:1-phosphatidylinositol 4-kinase n=1 Tax=Apostasia shenzhenica TaxID=1088818 RepID=A0A2I0AFT3_9ASPA|nr:putative phosphatidylinositol 4-kinase type 2-beta [Apostasia shenzhenica]
MSLADVALNLVKDDLTFSPVKIERSRSLHCLDDSILIYLAVSGSSVIPMRVLDTDSIALVKLQIQTSEGFVVNRQKLVFHGRELARNHCLVRDYGVGDGNLLHLVIRLSDLRFITVNTACGKKFQFNVERSQRVRYIKEQVAKKDEGFVDVENQKLICDGEELDDHLLIDEICEGDDAIIHLLIRKPAKVRTKATGKDFELSIDAPTITREDKKALVEPIIVNPEIKLSPVLMKLIDCAYAGLAKGNKPIISSEGSGGAYFMQDESGRKYVAVFKPIDEEPMAENNPRGLPLSVDGEGLKKGTRVGEGAFREVAAYILDHPTSGRRSFLSDEVGFSGVPPTITVRCLHSGDGSEIKDFKIGSLQMFVQNIGSSEDVGPRAFPVAEVHKIAVLDLRLANADRHAGNIMVCKEVEEEYVKLVPIDHGYCLPENFEDCTFDWLLWPQSRQPFDSATLDYIKSLDAEEDIALLKFYGWELSLDCSRTLRVSTMLLQKGAERGLTPYEIGSILCRETIKKESKIEAMICEAADAVLPGSSEACFMEAISEVMDHYLDKLKTYSACMI